MPKKELTEDELEKYQAGGDPRCQAVTEDGEQCRNKANENSDYCWIHEPQASKNHDLVKFDREKKRRVIKSIEDGKAHTLREAASRVGVTTQTLHDRADPDNPRYDKKFARELEIAKNKLLADYMKHMGKLARGDWKEDDSINKPSMQALQFIVVNMSSKGEKYIFPKATKNVMMQKQGGEESEQEEVTFDEIREALKDTADVELDEPNNGSEDEDFIDIESD